MSGTATDPRQVDVAIIGGGVNGLTAAALLARAGRSVVLLEAGDQLGGCATGDGMGPAPAQLVVGLPQSLARRLKLKKHGLTTLKNHVGRVALDPEGRHIPLAGASRITREAIFHWSSRDAENWRSLSATLDGLTNALRPFVTQSPPPLQNTTRREQLVWLMHLVRLRRHGRRSMQDLLQLMPSNAADLLEDRLETELLSGSMSLEATLTSRHGPRAPGTVLHWMWERALEAETRLGTIQVLGGAPALAAALTDAAQLYGADLRCTAEVASIPVEDGRVTGVVLQTGEEITATHVIAAIDPAIAALKLIGTEHIEAGTAHALSNIRPGGALARVELLLGQRPSIAKATDEILTSRMLLAPSVADVERAANATKYERLPEHPIAEVTMPSVLDRTGLEDGQERLSVLLPFMPLTPQEGWEAAGQTLVAKAIKLITEYAPDLPDLVEHAAIVTPDKIAGTYGAAARSWHQAELAADQLLSLRPIAQFASGAKPVDGLILGGVGSHPGGGANGRAALRAVHEVLASGRGART